MHLKLSYLVLLIPLFIFGCQSPRLQSQQEISELSKKENKGRPNIILITISSLRADHVGAYGYERKTTPHFDAFAQKSIIFENAFASSSWQMPSFGSILTSLYPSQHNATHIDKKMKECITLPGMLKNEKYYTAGFSCNPRLTESNGFAQGYDFYDDFSVNLLLESLSFGEEGVTFNINQQRTNDLINDAVIRWIDNNKHGPFFLSVHYYDNHWDYLPPEPYNNMFNPNYSGTIDGKLISKEPLYSNKPSDTDVEQIIALYDGQVRQTDEDLGELLTFLESSGRFKDSIIIVMGDHGEEFYEHGHTSHHSLYDELLHIPLAISFPGDNLGKYQSLFSVMDIMPTILDYLKIPIPEQCEGISLSPIIEGRKQDVREHLFFEYTGGAIPDVFAARSRRFKYIQPSDQEAFGFDLINDPDEQKKFSSEHFEKDMLTLQDYCRTQMKRLEGNESEMQIDGSNL